MSVFVDPMSPSPRTRNWRWLQSCHLIGDSEQELHVMADRLGLKRAWFQANATVPHYDLTAGKREQAIGMGAVPITCREMALRVRRARQENAKA